MFRPFCLEANGILLPQEWCLRVSHVHLAIWEADGNDQDPATWGVAVWRRAVYGGFQCFSNLGSTKSQLIEWRFNHHTWCFNHHRIWEGHFHGEFLWNSWAPTGSCFQRAGSRSGSLVIFEKKLGWAAFVSHQWIGGAHPYPEFKQMKVLKDSLRFSRAIFMVGDLSSCDAFLLNSINIYIYIFGTEPSRGVFVRIQNYILFSSGTVWIRSSCLPPGVLVYGAEEISSPVRARCPLTCWPKQSTFAPKAFPPRNGSPAVSRCEKSVPWLLWDEGKSLKNG